MSTMALLFFLCISGINLYENLYGATKVKCAEDSNLFR